jgi:hypothetical protein
VTTNTALKIEATDATQTEKNNDANHSCLTSTLRDSSSSKGESSQIQSKHMTSKKRCSADISTFFSKEVKRSEEEDSRGGAGGGAEDIALTSSLSEEEQLRWAIAESLKDIHT